MFQCVILIHAYLHVHSDSFPAGFDLKEKCSTPDVDKNSPRNYLH